jgi:hypothetical protein
LEELLQSKADEAKEKAGKGKGEKRRKFQQKVVILQRYISSRFFSFFCFFIS